MDTAVSVELFVEILNRYVYYFDQQNEVVSYSSPHHPLSPRSYALLISHVADHHQIHQWPYRAHSFQSTNKSR